MGIVLLPDQVRAAWSHAGDADSELRDARSRTTAAAGSAMGDLTATLGHAATDLRGVLDVVLGVIDAHGDNIETCIADHVATDGNSAGAFRGLAR